MQGRLRHPAQAVGRGCWGAPRFVDDGAVQAGYAGDGRGAPRLRAPLGELFDALEPWAHKPVTGSAAVRDR